MPVKPRMNESLQEKANERLDKQIGRAYLVWLVGLFVGALHLKPEKVEYGGLSFTVDSSDKLQGIIFVCLVFIRWYFGPCNPLSTAECDQRSRAQAPNCLRGTGQ
jgi:hypothetical protein